MPMPASANATTSTSPVPITTSAASTETTTSAPSEFTTDEITTWNNQQKPSGSRRASSADATMTMYASSSWNTATVPAPSGSLTATAPATGSGYCKPNQFTCQVLADPLVMPFHGSTYKFETTGTFYAFESVEMSVSVEIEYLWIESRNAMAYVATKATYECDGVIQTFRAADVAGKGAQQFRCSAGSCANSNCFVTIVPGLDPAPSVYVNQILYEGQYAYGADVTATASASSLPSLTAPSSPSAAPSTTAAATSTEAMMSSSTSFEQVPSSDAPPSPEVTTTMMPTSYEGETDTEACTSTEEVPAVTEGPSFVV
ncbi:hypothetical protein HDU81_010003 [Chytriomyces hyalinus]|nr:hypothetical protein HDU81_010003 [Chytriomyces hyalinus]